MSDLPGNWLVFRLSALGDAILATGVMNYWHRTRGWNFAVMTKEAFAPVFANNPAVSRVIAPSPPELRMPRMASFFASVAKEYEGWGLIDLHGTLRSRLLAMRWRGVVCRYPKNAFARRFFLRSGGRFYGEKLRSANVSQRYALAVEATPPPPNALLPSVYLSEEEIVFGKSSLANLFGDDVLKSAVGCVALHPFAAHRRKAWPKERYMELTAALDARRIPWVVIGRGSPLFPGNRRDLTNATSIRESAAILAACSALVTGDSGPMHLAAAVKTPVVALFGATTRE